MQMCVCLHRRDWLYQSKAEKMQRLKWPLTSITSWNCAECPWMQDFECYYQFLSWLAHSSKPPEKWGPFYPHQALPCSQIKWAGLREPWEHLSLHPADPLPLLAEGEATTVHIMCLNSHSFPHPLPYGLHRSPLGYSWEYSRLLA